MNSQLYQTDSCVVLCVANCRGKLSQVAKLASECSADAVLHIGDFGLTISWSTRTPDTTPSLPSLFLLLNQSIEAGRRALENPARNLSLVNKTRETKSMTFNVARDSFLFPSM
ncbi:hypothetical protein BCR33DRAFT_309294 [Rhizoclosmatium globosum]|uniref:Uncharacterized protein n=1 Tax=Rhizoclosmatium globosum TaxID=329046 RepID=A0A1Y2C5R1_9FUNG|nr:hypothetical protein BCR33DRAFT_309294 [Rhizoclosmatium globosum]|eukprot:ORY42380.1 hypothetical protein BCR33DRAFT_309294 [Rhizoclosmatium globosum]